MPKSTEGNYDGKGSYGNYWTYIALWGAAYGVALTIGGIYFSHWLG